MKKMVILTVAVFLFGVNLISAQAAKNGLDTLRYKSNPNYAIQLSMYDVYKMKQADIVMFGNSLTHGALWNQLLSRSNVFEMGIPSDILRGYLARLHYVIKLKPKIVFIMGGLNDIYNWTPIEDVFGTYVKILVELKANNIIPVVQSTTYSAKTYGKEYGGTAESNGGRNREVDKLNKLLLDYCTKNKIEYMNVTPLLSTSDGFLRPDLTWDGVHLKSEAYRIWAREVEKVLRKYNM